MSRLLFLVMVSLSNIAAAQQEVYIDSTTLSKSDIFYDYEPTYVLIQRAVNWGIQRAIRDDAKGNLAVCRYYKTIDSSRVKVIEQVLQKKYGLRLIVLSGILSDETRGYSVQATKLAQDRFGNDFWQKVEQQTDIILKTACADQVAGQ